MSRRWTAAILILLCSVLPCRADVVILKNGKEYRGELNNARTLHLNPLSLDKITILLEKGGSPESKLVTFDARDVDKIILETFEAKQIIDLSALRQQRFERPEAESPRERPTLETGESVVVTPDTETGETEPPDSDLWGDDSWKSNRIKGFGLAGGGALLLGTGALIGFGGDGDLNGANFFLIGAGAGLVGYGLYKALKARPDGPGSEIQLEVDPSGGAGVSIRWRF